MVCKNCLNGTSLHLRFFLSSKLQWSNQRRKSAAEWRVDRYMTQVSKAGKIISYLTPPCQPMQFSLSLCIPQWQQSCQMSGFLVTLGGMKRKKQRKQQAEENYDNEKQRNRRNKIICNINNKEWISSSSNYKSKKRMKSSICSNNIRGGGGALLTENIYNIYNIYGHIYNMSSIRDTTYLSVSRRKLRQAPRSTASRPTTRTTPFFFF